MRHDTKCVECGEPITDESPSGDPAQRKPCSKCGSKARAFSLQGSVTVHASASAELTVVTYPQALLAMAQGLIEEGRCNIGVVVAHMACEVAAERSLSAAFAAKGLQYIEEPIVDLLNGYNLANDKNRKLYTALTGNAIEKEAFWKAFKESATRRNKVVHNAGVVTKVEAAASHGAAAALVKHLKQ